MVDAAVFAPSPLLTVTVEQEPNGEEEIHLHAGGQGFWIARMIVALGGGASLCAPLGGEGGPVLRALVEAEGVTPVSGASTRGNGAYVHDRRDGDRTVVAEMRPAVLSRHEVDALFSASLAAGLAADVAVLGGPHAPDVVPSDVYRRLAADLRSAGVDVVADLSGETLTAALEGGVTVIKVSHEDLMEDGRIADDDPQTLLEAMHDLAREGARHVVISRGADPTMALVDGEPLTIAGPQMQLVDHRGAGDSMTAGMAVALGGGEDMREALRLGAAAGTANVTRKGLATGQRQLVEQLARRIDVQPLR